MRGEMKEDLDFSEEEEVVLDDIIDEMELDD